MTEESRGLVKGKPLSPEQKERIWDAIGSYRLEGDRDPQVVIQEDYGGDGEHYLRVMARFHGVELE